MTTRVYEPSTWEPSTWNLSELLSEPTEAVIAARLAELDRAAAEFEAGRPRRGR